MRHPARLAIALAVLLLARCGGSSTSPTPPFSNPILEAPTSLPPPPSYTLSGLVKEAWIDTGLPGATVTIATGPTRAATTTDDQGRYTLSHLLPGVYSLTFSKPAPYGSTTYGPVTVAGDTTFSGALSLSGGFPVTAANLQGYWVAQGPYPNEPCWILLFQNGTKLEGWYKDRQNYSTAMSGRYTGDAVFLDVGTAGLTIDGHVEDARCIRGFIKNDALGGGNFPIAISRGGSCSD